MRCGVAILLGFALLCGAGRLRAQESATGDLAAQAAAAHKSGDLGKAIALYREFLKEHPDAAQIRSNLGAALAQAGQFSEAIVEYQSALAQIPSNERVRMNLALAFYKLGRLGETIAQLTELHAQQPAQVDPALLLADCLMQNGRNKDAVEILTPFAEEDPDSKAVNYLLGMALLRDNRVTESQAVLDRILRDGNSAEGEFLLGQMEYRRQHHLEAAEHLRRAIQLNPQLPGVHSLYGRALHMIGGLEDEPAQYAEELKINPFDFVANLETGARLKLEGKYDEAVPYVERALRVRPDDPGALFQLATIHQGQGLATQAIAELRKLTAAYPGFTEAHAALATLLFHEHRREEGERELEIVRGLRQQEEKRLDDARREKSSNPPASASEAPKR